MASNSSSPWCVVSLFIMFHDLSLLVFLSLCISPESAVPSYKSGHCSISLLLFFSVQAQKQENDETETDLHSCFFYGFFSAHMTVSFCVHTLLVSWSFSARVSVSLFRKINFLFSFSFPPQNEEEEGETDIEVWLTFDCCVFLIVRAFFPPAPTE